MNIEVEPKSLPPNQKKMGSGMLIVAWAILLLMLVKIFGQWEDKQINPNQQLSGQLTQQGERIVTLKRNRHGHYVLNGTINQEKVTFVLDTGATTVSIPGTLAQRLGLEKGMEKNAFTANGTIQVYGTELEHLSIGNIELHNVVADINPHMEGEEILLGMSVLKYLDFSQQGDTLTLRQL